MRHAVLNFQAARNRLVEHISGEVRDQRVLQAMRRVPRELFVLDEYRSHAYDDRPLPIGFGQTISQPVIVALMTEALGLEGGEKVLEVGTGSGYQAAVLAELARYVVTTERIGGLARRARETLSNLGYVNLDVHLTMDELGWSEGAPYDAIIVTAGAPQVPSSLLEQLSPGGRLVIPVGSYYEQELLKVTRTRDTEITSKMGACRFVPLIGSDAWLGEEAW